MSGDVTTQSQAGGKCLGCGEPSKMRCPTCSKMSLPEAPFCSQACFQSNWKDHKQVHQKSTEKVDSKDGPLHWGAYDFTGPLRPWNQSPKRFVPEHIVRTDYADHPKGTPVSEEAARSDPIAVLPKEDIDVMRETCQLARKCLDAACAAVKPGVTTDELDRIVHEVSIAGNAYPSPLNYYRFPKSCCTSVNEVICHGIPDMRPLEEGDIVNIDVTVYVNGFHGDLNETVFVGKPRCEDDVKLISTAYDCMMSAIEMVRPGVKYRDLGTTISRVAAANQCSVTKSYTGHGIHRLFHTAPNVPHYHGNKAPGVMKRGHVFTIEPMINAGKYRDIQWPDDWTAVTSDGKRSAQFEQTMTVTDTGVDILTKRPGGLPWFYDQLKGWNLTDKYAKYLTRFM